MRISDWSSDVCSSDLLMTDWMGDDGFLRRLNVRVRDHNLLGDATWCKGTVTAKRVEEGQAIVSADRKSVVEGKSVSVRVDPGGRRTLNNNTHTPPLPPPTPQYTTTPSPTHPPP